MRMNADGFGLGWYGSKHGATKAAVFRSITPAWSNRNLRELAGVVKSTCCFAHVRAATPGSVVSEENTHPFRHGRLLFQHNGHVEGFSRVRRRLVARLPDELYERVSGSTDSEHCFALVLAQLDDPGRATPFDVSELEFAVLRTIAILKELGAAEGITEGFSTRAAAWNRTRRETKSRRRRGHDVDIPRGRRGGAAATTWIFRGDDGAAATTWTFRGDDAAAPRLRRGYSIGMLVSSCGRA